MTALDPLLLFVAVAALLAGLVRGFSGFGYALVFMPLAAIPLGPVTALGLLWLIDAPYAFLLVIQAVRMADWRHLAPIVAGAVLATPLGTALLVRLDAITVRWAIGLSILGGVGAIAAGWRLQRAGSAALHFGIGLVSGLYRGLAGLGGLPLALFWISGAQKAETIRANSQGFLGVMTMVSGVVYFLNGVFANVTLAHIVAGLGAYGAGVLIGARAFGLASDVVFRRIGLVMIGVAAFIGLPLLDRLWR
jgi:hypothetical protein